MSQLEQIREEWIRIVAKTNCSDEQLYRYLRDGGLNYIQAQYIVEIRNK